MNTNLSRTQELIDRPGESLSVELKRWIDPDQPEGIAKIAKTSLALRNFNGGYLIIGFDNDTLKPDEENTPGNVISAFHIDKIQGIVSRFSSEAFEISVEYPERDGQQYPVIIVPSGVKTPVASKSDLKIEGKNIIRADDIYIRSLQSNNTPSTTRATWKDWPKIVEICFDNREADIGRFLRRHLGGVTPAMFKEFASVVAKGIEPESTSDELLLGYLQEGKRRYEHKVKERSSTLPEHGAWEVALLVNGEVPAYSANKDFLNLLDSSNPDYTGWPVWLDSRGFTDVSNRPYVYGDAWESFIASISTGWNEIDFMRLDPKGKFYLYRALEDDISGSSRSPKPFSTLDFGLPIILTAEAIAVGISFLKAMGCNPENTQLDFAFRWTRLRDRELSSWASPRRYIYSNQKAYQDEVISYVTVPLDAPLSALSEYVNQATKPLFEVFGGFVLDKDVVEDLTRRLIERRL